MPKLATSVLASLVRVKDLSTRAGASGQHIQKSVFNQRVRHPLPKAIAQYLAYLDAQNDSQIEPSFFGGKVSGATNPGWRGIIDGKLTIQHITSHRHRMAAVCTTGPEAALGLGPDMFLLHQPPDPSVAH